MNLIRQYADRVAYHLPAKLKEETADELYDSLCEQFEDANSHNSNLSEEEFLNQQPHPIRMATQLGENENLYLIGPGFYLSFIEALKYAAWIAIAIQLPFLVGNILQGGDPITTFIKSIAGFPGTFINVAIVITLIFIVIEKAGGHPAWLDDWDAKTLKDESKKNTFSKFELLIELNVYILVALWLSSAIEVPYIKENGGFLITELMNIPESVSLMILGLLVFDIIITAIKLIQGYWVKWLRVIDAVFTITWLFMLVYLVNIDPLINSSALHESIQTEVLINIINRSVDIAMLIAGVILIWELAKHAMYFLRNSNR